MHSVINPSIWWWGTPVALVSTENEDGTPNIAPMSSAWWLGARCVLGLASISQTTINLVRTGQCVLNLPSDDMASHINSLARTTGTPDVPLAKQGLGYHYCKDKFGVAGFTPEPSGLVRPPRIGECPVQMECELASKTELQKDIPELQSFYFVIEVKVLRTYARDDILMDGYANRIDPDRWHPMIMNFQQLYGLAPKRAAESKLASIDEEKYRALAK